ncbi:glycosyltransferase family 32 protein [Myriangium duriaei CBS 260.36]|uniref:Glycosyltransferase family 32 protein n=1 Tax=Myriangium duriaei CBS 260.36 TaxID=1168546 RepID=A0A9P4J4S5_9PEZI|nr:glycosyltransferase family 32 protein [Myriangium duriaei CBS 260.36]
MKLESAYKEYTARTPEICVPKQIRRILPACAAILLFLFFISSNVGGGYTDFLKTHDTSFPRKIWQTWKVHPLDFEERDLNLARSWIQKNPKYRYEVLTDQNDIAYVEREFGPNGLNRMDIVYTYRSLTAKIIKADLLRYLVMYVEGGVYTDIDVEALRPIERFIPERFNERDVDMVIGVEIDQPEFRNHSILGQKCESFCQWTFMCKPRLPVMLKLVENIMAWLKTVQEEQKVGIQDIKLDFDQVISGTGPSAFTNAILKDLSEKTGRHITWEMFHGISESKHVANVLVLPVEAFAAGQGHSDSGNHDTKYSLVRHHYHASQWPSSHPRYKHPMVGQVEDCNWNMECVERWDNDKAAFDALPSEEQEKRIAIKHALDAGEHQEKR